MLESRFPNFHRIDPKSQTSLLHNFVNIAIQFHQRVATVFLPTAIKFHYLFNLRDLSNIVQVKTDRLTLFDRRIVVFSSKGMLFASSKTIINPQDLIRLYLHEAERTYSDKLMTRDDLDLFQKILRETIRKSFDVGVLPRRVVVHRSI